MNNINSLCVLFDLWKEAHGCETDASYISGNVPANAFLPDGIIDEEQFNLKTEKVLFIGKEAHWFRPEDSAEKSAENAGIVMFWHRRVAFGKTPETMFSKRLSLLANAFFSGDYTTVNKDHKVLQSVAFLNLNKRGGFSYCKWDTLEAYVSRYKDYISKEIELISPTTIICCGDGVRWLLNKYIDVSSSVKVLTISHPSYFALSDLDYLSQLECVVQNKPWKLQKISSADSASDRKIKGIIFDTNKTYSEGATFDMLTSGKISAFGGASRFINSFSTGDYAFYYVKGKGVVAAGTILSETAIQSDYNDSNESYKMVQLLVPKNIPLQEKDLRAVPYKQMVELLRPGRGFYMASTTKRPYLNEGDAIKLINKLKSLYNE